MVQYLKHRAGYDGPRLPGDALVVYRRRQSRASLAVTYFASAKENPAFAETSSYSIADRLWQRDERPTTQN
jgi:hypothetical protein